MRPLEGIEELRRLHEKMDVVVLAAYGWHEDSAMGPALELRHDFYEVDFLPENDRVRYTIHPDARREDFGASAETQSSAP